MTDTLRRRRVRAPGLTGRAWLNTSGEALTMVGLRGRVVVLDFWTFCCVNCLHVIEEMRPLEERYAGVATFVGIHSPKFEHEADPDALAAAVERYAVHHPVLDDPELTTWKAYTARAWPTLVVVDPEGYIVASLSGEGHAHGLSVLIDALVEEHSAKGTLRPVSVGVDAGGRQLMGAPHQTALRFPGKVVGLPGGGYLVSDTAHGQIVELAEDLETERRRYGSPDVLGSPQGLLMVPDQEAARVGYDVVIADSTRHLLLGLRLDDGAVLRLAGTGEQLRQRSGGGNALRQPLSTPWDLTWFADRVVVAMAGVHQLWVLHLARDPADNTVAVLAGTSEEGLRDGRAEDAWLAQPSGLATSADGTRVWVADSETSSLRSLTLTDEGFEVETHVGQGLFDFGHVDGPATEALMQHPLGVTVLPDGSVAISDTYNGAIRRFDPSTQTVSTVAIDLAEPSDAAVEVDEVSGTAYLVVVESAAHRLVRLALPEHAQRIDGDAHRTERPPTLLRPGPVELSVAFVPPGGQKLDDRYGDPTRLWVSSTPSQLLREGEGVATGLSRALDLDARVGSGILHISVQAAACDTVGEHPSCMLYQQDWGIPVVLDEAASAELRLDLRGV